MKGVVAAKDHDSAVLEDAEPGRSHLVGTNGRVPMAEHIWQP